MSPREASRHLLSAELYSFKRLETSPSLSASTISWRRTRISSTKPSCSTAPSWRRSRILASHAFLSDIPFRTKTSACTSSWSWASKRRSRGSEPGSVSAPAIAMRSTSSTSALGPGLMVRRRVSSPSLVSRYTSRISRSVWSRLATAWHCCNTSCSSMLSATRGLPMVSKNASAHSGAVSPAGPRKIPDTFSMNVPVASLRTRNRAWLPGSWSESTRRCQA